MEEWIPRYSPIRGVGLPLSFQSRDYTNCTNTFRVILVWCQCHLTTPSWGRETQPPGRKLLSRKKRQIPFPQCSCLLCLPESPKHSSPNALLSDAEGKILPWLMAGLLQPLSSAPQTFPLSYGLIPKPQPGLHISWSSRQSLSTKSPSYP